MLQSLDAFLKKWFLRFRICSFLAASWAVFFTTFTVMGLRAAFEYDDGLVFSTPAYNAAKNRGTGPDSSAYWNAVNVSYKLERTKPAVWATAWLLRLLGFKVDIICHRGPAGSDGLVRSWKPLAGEFFFTVDENSKYELLEEKQFALYFAVSDSDVIQARKAGVWTVRVRKNRKSVLPAEASPRKFGEPVLPLSEF